MYWFILYNSFSFTSFAFAIACYSFSTSCISGTDEALLYDTTKEFGQEEVSLKRLAHYFSARSLIRIFLPIIAAFIAKDFTNWQFNILIIIDVVATFVALLLAIRLTEPNHKIDLEKSEAGIIKSAYSIIKKNKLYKKAIMSNVFIFIAFLVVWQYHQQMFITMGIPLIALGVFLSVKQIILFFINLNITKIYKKNSTACLINRMCIFFT